MVESPSYLKQERSAGLSYGFPFPLALHQQILRKPIRSVFSDQLPGFEVLIEDVAEEKFVRFVSQVESSDFSNETFPVIV